MFDNPIFFNAYQQTVTPNLNSRESFTELFHFQGENYLIVYLETLNIQQQSVGYYTFVMPAREYKAIVSTRRIMIITSTVVYLLIALMLYVLYQRQQAILTLATRDPLRDCTIVINLINLSRST